MACRIPIGRIGNASSALVSRTTVGFLNPSTRCRPISDVAGVTRASQRPERYGNQPPPQSFLARVFADHAAVGHDVRAPDLEDAAFTGRKFHPRQQVRYRIAVSYTHL